MVRSVKKMFMVSIPLIAMIISALVGLGGLVGVYVVLKTTDTKQEGEIESLKAENKKLEARVIKLEDKVTDKLSDIENTNISILMKLTEMETILKIKFKDDK